MISLGTYPDVSLSMARDRRNAARRLLETARRTKQRVGRVFRHAIGLKHPVRDITVDLRGLLPRQ